MKEIENYVCTLEQAKRLAGLEVKQDSLFYYNQAGKILKRPNQCAFTKYSAFTSQELGELIIKLDRQYPWMGMGCNIYGFYYFQLHSMRYQDYFVTSIEFNNGAGNEAEAKAEFLIHLMEKKCTKITICAGEK